VVRRWTPTATRDWQVRIAARGTIIADPERLGTALDGVRATAVKATDEGRGIAPEDLPRIFDRFAKVEADRARSNGGTGLGLSITKAIVEAPGGVIAENSEEGRGTTFRIELGGFRAVASPSGASFDPTAARAVAGPPSGARPATGA
jgi:signal transduction histidine kinase